MIRSSVAWCALAAVLSVVGVTGVSAHHGTLVSYDREKQWTAKATVTDFRYLNPHAQIYFDVTDDKGTVAHWSGELLPNPAQLIATGWTRRRSMDALKAGTPITITVAPARAGGNVVLVMRILNEKGEELLGAQPAPPAAPPSAARP
ncbi:MAG TPA: DUF6152 family protein [Vicinamibacterales bacterium]|nr:DUF6152 family protein [Vicinamibacterales bacterium]